MTMVGRSAERDCLSKPEETLIVIYRSTSYPLPIKRSQLKESSRTQEMGRVNIWSNASFYEVLTNYYYYRFSNSRIQYTRTYSSIKATPAGGGVSSQLNLKLLVGHIITDIVNGVSTDRLFYATSISKDVKKNEAIVIWVAQ